MVFVFVYFPNSIELQNVHLNEITQFDFAEVIRQVSVGIYSESDLLVNPCDTPGVARFGDARSERLATRHSREVATDWGDSFPPN